MKLAAHLRHLEVDDLAGGQAIGGDPQFAGAGGVAQRIGDGDNSSRLRVLDAVDLLLRHALATHIKPNSGVQHAINGFGFQCFDILGSS